MKIKSILLIFLLIFLTGCSSDNYNPNVFSCESAEFIEESNVYSICEEIYDSYDSYFRGNFSQFISGSKNDCIESCISEFYNYFENDIDNYLEVCDAFISGNGGFVEIYLPDDFEQPLINWCEDNYSIKERYLSCFE